MSIKIISKSLLGSFIALQLFTYSSRAQTNFTTIVQQPINVLYGGKPPEMSQESYNQMICPESSSIKYVTCSIGNPSNDIQPGLFPLMIGYSLPQIKNYIVTNELTSNLHNDDYYENSVFNIKTKVLDKNHKFLIFSKKSKGKGSLSQEAYFIIDKSNTAVGAIFFNFQNIWNLSNAQYYSDITSQNHYQSNKKRLIFNGIVNRKHSNKFDIYIANRNDDFTEAYMIMTPGQENIKAAQKLPYKIFGEKIIFSQVFIPKSLEKKLSNFYFSEVMLKHNQFNTFVKQVSN